MLTWRPIERANWRSLDDADMVLTIGPLEPDQFDGTARVMLRAFDDVADHHGYPRDLPSLDVARDIVRYKHTHPQTFGAIARIDERVVGSIFMLRSDPVGGIGPVTVDPREQGSGIGRALLQAAIDNAIDRDGIRLTQDAYNLVSLALYASRGFEVKEPLVEMSGQPRSGPPAGVEFRPMTAADLGECAALYRAVHGVDRTNELRDSLRLASPHFLRRDGRIVAYTSRLPIVFDAHGVAETEEDLRVLILRAAARSNGPVSLVVPTRQARFFRWCLAEGLRATKPMTLMARGVYHEPRGAWFPSVLY
jgi:GNAT superfamily N-acetyltransferase